MNRYDLIKERAELFEEYGDEIEDIKEDAAEVEPCDLPVDDGYCRGDKDVVISGPLGPDSKAKGRRFNTEIEALHWATDKYGANNVSLVKGPEGAARWAVLVKKLRR